MDFTVVPLNQASPIEYIVYHVVHMNFAVTIGFEPILPAKAGVLPLNYITNMDFTNVPISQASLVDNVCHVFVAGTEFESVLPRLKV